MIFVSKPPTSGRIEGIDRIASLYYDICHNRNSPPPFFVGVGSIRFSETPCIRQDLGVSLFLGSG